MGDIICIILAPFAMFGMVRALISAKEWHEARKIRRLKEATQNVASLVYRTIRDNQTRDQLVAELLAAFEQYYPQDRITDVIVRHSNGAPQ